MRRLLGSRPCSCGSGRAARDCCGRFARLSEADAARAYLRRQAKAARDLLVPFSPDGIMGLRRELQDLPERHDEFVAVLHASAAPETTRLRNAAERHQRPAGRPDALDNFIGSVLRRVELPMARVGLAKVALALREDAVIDDHLAAAALVDLADNASLLLHAALCRFIEDDRRGLGVQSHGLPAHA